MFCFNSFAWLLNTRPSVVTEYPCGKIILKKNAPYFIPGLAPRELLYRALNFYSVGANNLFNANIQNLFKCYVVINIDAIINHLRENAFQFLVAFCHKVLPAACKHVHIARNNALLFLAGDFPRFHEPSFG